MAEKLGKKGLKRYMMDQLDSGHSVGSILKHLVDHGHRKEDIEAIFDDILDEEESRRQKLIHLAAESLFIILFAIFVFWIGVSSDSPFEAVFFGFLPTIVFIILVLVISEKRFRTDIIPAMPLLLGFLFYIGATMSSIEVLQKMEIGKLAFLNLILSYLFIGVIYYSEFFSSIRIPGLSGGETFGEIEEIREKADVEELRSMLDSSMAMRKAEAEKHPVYVEVKPKEEKAEPVEKLVQSLEGNLKALNAVIGRVYRKANGGTELIRDLIKIKPEWYNSFNVLISKSSSKSSRGRIDKEVILKTVDAIERRLDTMFKKERELFGAVKFRNLQRDPDGNSKIIDVLMLNDSDPVENYFENALVTCGKIKERL